MRALDLDALIARRRPSHSLEQPFYADEGVFARDVERVFWKQWLFAGHTTEIPKPGDYFTYAVGSDSVIVIRDDEGGIRGLFNTCRHRGSAICLEERGHARKLVCPYHQWAYEKDGRLASARLMPADFDRSAFSLASIATHVVEGLIFLCFDPNPPDFRAASEAYRAHLAPYEFERSRIVARRHYDLATNWKLIAENFRECYHCGGGHPEYCRAVIGTTLVEDPERVAAVARDRREHWQRHGLETATLGPSPDRWYLYSRYPFRPGFVCESLDGQPVAPRMGRIADVDAGVFAIVNLPNFWLEASSDYIWTMRVTPIHATRTLVDVYWSVRADAVEGQDFDVERLTAFWRATAEQDWELCVNNQRGINSSRYQPGPYAPCEREVEVFLQWYLRHLGSEGEFGGNGSAPGN